MFKNVKLITTQTEWSFQTNIRCNFCVQKILPKKKLENNKEKMIIYGWLHFEDTEFRPIICPECWISSQHEISFK